MNDETEKIHECAKKKDINENVVDDKIKSEDHKNVLLKRSYMIQK